MAELMSKTAIIRFANAISDRELHHLPDEFKGACDIWLDQIMGDAVELKNFYAVLNYLIDVKFAKDTFVNRQKKRICERIISDIVNVYLQDAV